MNILGINVHLHKWTYIYGERNNTFMGKYITDYYKEYRVCSVCGYVQHLDHYGFDWCGMSDNRSEIIKDRMINDSYTTDAGKLVLNKRKISLPRIGV